MEKIIGIRREDKNQWERRTPLIPEDVKELKEKFGIQTIVQPSDIRIFSDQEYQQAGAVINEDLSRAPVIFGVKEMPIEFFEQGKTYMFFSHVIKGQPYNMPMLKRMMDLSCNLIDYEKVVNEKNQRLIFFGRYAGLAGMIETFYEYGKKMKLRGLDTPFARFKQAYEYSSLQSAKNEIAEIGEEIGTRGFPGEMSPLVVGFAGYGNVSRGAQEIFDLLPHKIVSPQILAENYENFSNDDSCLYKVVFKEEDLVKPISGEFDLQDYYTNPQNYRSVFPDYIPYLQILVNCIYWTEAYPRLITRQYLRDNTVLRSNLNLKVIGDISCDVNGSIEITHKVTYPDHPVYTYFAEDDKFKDGSHRRGVAVMAVDNLPCEFSREASSEFSVVLKNYVNNIVEADMLGSSSDLGLPSPIQKAMILHQGNLNHDYKYISKYIK